LAVLVALRRVLPLGLLSALVVLRLAQPSAL